MNLPKHNSNRSNQPGFTLPQLLITLAVVSVVVAVAVMGVTRARASLRLSNATRQFAAYIERARADAVRRHAQASVQMVTTSTYSVTMDFGSDGTVVTQTFPLESNVTFITELKTITFDWRGRIPAEISVGFGNESGTANVNITGSGDVTIDSEIFHDASVPDVNYNANVSGDVVPDPAATPTATATPAPSPSPSPSASPDASASPTPSPSPSASPTATATPPPTPTPTPTPTPSPSPTPTPSPAPCTMTVAPSPLTVVQNGSGSITAVLNNLSGTATVTATSSNSGQIQVSPSSRTVSGLGSASFTVTVKKQSGSVTLSSSCGSQTVTVTVP